MQIVYALIRLGLPYHMIIMSFCGKKKLLTLMTSLCASSAFVLLCIGVATDDWLYTEEKVELQFEVNEKNKTDLYKRTSSGLWRKCMIDERKSKIAIICSYIKYFANQDAEDEEPTETILLNMRRSTIFPLFGLLLLLMGEITSFIGLCTHKTKILTFVAGILFVVSGLCVLTGLILYIVSITNEVGNKPKDKSDTPKFVYEYGSSFMMTISAFLLCEIGGVASVYLYISRHKHEYRKKQERLILMQASSNQRHNSGHFNHPRRSRSYSRDRESIAAESYFTYTPVSDTPKELSNYTMSRDISRQTMSTTTAETHLCRDYLYMSRSAENLRRTTPV